MNTFVLLAILYAGGGAPAAPPHPSLHRSAQQCAGIVARLPKSETDAIVGSADAASREAALSNLDVVVSQLEQRPGSSHALAVEDVKCVAGAFMASTRGNLRWKNARGNFAAWLRLH